MAPDQESQVCGSLWRELDSLTKYHKQAVSLCLKYLEHSDVVKLYTADGCHTVMILIVGPQ